MEARHSPEARALLMQRFRERLERLNESVKHDWPAPVVCLGISLCLRSALVLYGDYAANIVGEMLLEQARTSAGLCPHCGVGALVESKGMCAPCWDSAAEDDEAAKEAE